MSLPMEQVVTRCGNCDVDLESGEAVLGYKVSNEPVTGGFNEMGQLLSNACSGFGSCDGSTQCEAIVDKKTVAGEKKTGILEKKPVKEKPKAMSAKKPPRPPRPPRGLSLDLADQKLIKELVEIAKLKRERIERMKALMKTKDSKTSSPKFATLFTILFCIVILFQGISSRTNSAATLQVSPMTSAATGGIISMVQFQNLSANDADGPGIEPPSLVEPVSVSNTLEKAVG